MYTEIRFPELDVRFIAINDGVDSEDQPSNDFTPFRNIMNEWYAKDTSKKITAVFRAKGMSGQRISTHVPYGFVLDDNKKLVPDEETAPVVQMIFQLCIEGNGPGKIARILREREIKTPRTMEFLRTGRSDYYDPEHPCGWNCGTVANILDNKEYLGHTVNFKTRRKSFKSKKVLKNPEDQQVIFENTHEAIISPELWEVVQKNREHRHRPTRMDVTPLFSGLLFCADCGSRLNFHKGSANGKTRDSYICSKYRTAREVQRCESHYIREDALTSLVLENLRKVISYARDYEDEFVQQVSDKTLADQMKRHTAMKRQLEQQTRRIGELDAIIQRLYEDMVKGTLTTERFSKMSAAYEQEQKKLEDSVAKIQVDVNACETQKVNVKSFLQMVRSYIEPDQLTPDILHMFVEKIIVHNADKSNGHRVQQVDIYYNFVGQFDMSVEMSRTRKRTKAEILAQNALNQQGA